MNQPASVAIPVNPAERSVIERDVPFIAIPCLLTRGAIARRRSGWRTSRSAPARSSGDAWRLPATDASVVTAHQSPDERQGPAAMSTRPAGIPVRSAVTRTGRDSRSCTRIGSGCRKRRSAGAAVPLPASPSRDAAVCWRASRCVDDGRGVLHRERRHRERTRAMRVEDAGGAAAILSHERGQPCHERGQLLGRGQRALEQRELQHAPGVGSTRTITPSMPGAGRMRFEVEQRQRSQHARIADGRRQLQAPHVRLARDQPQARGRGRPPPGRAARGARTPGRAGARARTTTARVLRWATRDRGAPRRSSSGTSGTSGPVSSPRASRCTPNAGLAEARRELRRGQRRQVAERPDAPSR